jgi:hypothetical protein
MTAKSLWKQELWITTRRLGMFTTPVRVTIVSVLPHSIWCNVFRRQALPYLQPSFRVPNPGSPALLRPTRAVSVPGVLLTLTAGAAQLVRAISTVIHVVTYQVGVYAELSVTPEVLACQFCKCKQRRGQSCFWTSETGLVRFPKQIRTEYYCVLGFDVV